MKILFTLIAPRKYDFPQVNKSYVNAINVYFDIRSDILGDIDLEFIYKNDLCKSWLLCFFKYGFSFHADFVYY